MEQNTIKKKNFHRHIATPGVNLYWIIIAYIIIGWFYPVIGLIALICMILHLRHVWHPTDTDCSLERGRTGHVERYWSRVLDHYPDDHHCWYHPLVHLCTSHLVFVLSDGNHLVVGSSS